MEDDEQLMQQLSHGNDTALDVLVFRYHRPLFGYIYRLVMEEQLAEDIVQDTFLTVYQQGKKGFIPDKFKPWLYRIAGNACKDHWRKANTRKVTVSEEEVRSHQSVVHMIDRSLERQWMLDRLGELPLQYRMVLFLRFYQDMKYDEIATALDIPANTAKTRVARALQKLESLMEVDKELEVTTRGSSRQPHR